MVDKNLINEIGLSDAELEAELQETLGAGFDQSSIGQMIDSTVTQFQPGSILKGRVVNIVGNDVIVEVGLKSEGVGRHQRVRRPRRASSPASEIEVLLEAVEGDSGLVVLSKRKADRIRGWERIIAQQQGRRHGQGHGHPQDQGRPAGGHRRAGVPAGQPGGHPPPGRHRRIHRPGRSRPRSSRSTRSAATSSSRRRKLIEERRAEAKTKLLAEIQEGQVRKGVVKNIADFGAFVDLGGIDGLLHITDMSWGRISHPSEMLKIDQEIEVMVLQRRPREGEDRPGPQAEARPARGRTSRSKYPVGTARQGRGGQHHVLRRVRASSRRASRAWCTSPR